MERTASKKKIILAAILSSGLALAISQSALAEPAAQPDAQSKQVTTPRMHRMDPDMQKAHEKFLGDTVAIRKQLVEKTLQVLLAPYRKEDADEAMEIVKSNGGTDKLHMAFYQNGDLGNDKVWDMWRVEGPGFVWHFRGAPHVHAYINIGAVKPKV